MEQHRTVIVLVCVAVYMVMCIGFGLWALRRTRSTSDFFVAGRDLGVLVTALAVFSSTLSGFGFVGGPGLVYSMGTSSIWMIVCSSMGYALSFVLLGKRMRIIAELRDTVSVPDAVQARYGSRPARFLTAVAILLGVLGYLATQLLAMATVLQALLASTSWFAEISFVTCVLVSVAVLLFYCVTGGIIASVYTDVVQGAVMIVAAGLVFLTCLSVFDGGPAAGIDALMRDDPESIGPWGTLGMMGALSWYFVFALGSCGQPHVVSKFMMARRVGDIRHILWISICGFAVAALLWLGIGLAMRALVVAGQHPELAAPDEAATVFLQRYAHPLLAGVVFAGLFAAIMSTADGFLNIGAAALVHDIPGSLRGRSLSHELLWARIGTCGIGLAAVCFALYSHYVNERLVALLGAFGWSTFAAALVPTVAIGFNWKRATGGAACVAIVSSLLVNFGLEIFGIRLPHGFSGGAASLLVSLLLFVVVSLLQQPPALDPDIREAMDL